MRSGTYILELHVFWNFMAAVISLFPSLLIIGAAMIMGVLPAAVSPFLNMRPLFPNGGVVPMAR